MEENFAINKADHYQPKVFGTVWWLIMTTKESIFLELYKTYKLINLIQF